MRNMIQVAEGTVTKPEHSSIPGTPLESSAVSISEHNLPYKPPPPHSSVSISEDTPSQQPMPPAGRRGLLKDIFLECSPPHHFNDELMLSISWGCNNENLRLAKISSEKWKAVENINFQHDAGDMVLIVHSKDGSDVAFLKFTANEIYTMVCAEEDTPAEYVFASVEEDNPVSVRMTSTIFRFYE
ncbi:hypothetical protein BYT27DRAFT_6453647 [Phlegmacium glaucopus]|nr:hypothetical protein BYT27DRAFT_6453647 [Phlegmacium glaucopus]